MRDSTDAVIVGAGVIGSALALELGRKGYRTVNVDKLAAAGYGPTSNSCAIVRAHYSTPEGVALAWDNFTYWENWADYLGVHDERGLARFVQCGTILLKSGSNGGDGAQASHWHKVRSHYSTQGIPFEEWDAQELRQRVPYLSLGSFWPPSRPTDESFWAAPPAELEGAIFTPTSGYVNDPQLASHNLQVAAEAGGARFLFKQEVVEIRAAGGRVSGVTLGDGTVIDADIVVNVAGPWSFLVNRLAGVEESMNIKTHALRHEVHLVPAPPDVDLDKYGVHVSDGDQAIYFRPDVGNTFLIGSEDPPCDPKVWVSSPDDFDRSITAAQWEAQVYRLARRIEGLGIPHQKRGVVDLYDVSDDWIPIYDNSAQPGYYMAVGTSGNQFKNAAGVAHVMATLIDSCENGHDHDAQPVQVRLRNTNHVLDLAAYSHRRSFNPESSLSVNG